MTSNEAAAVALQAQFPSALIKRPTVERITTLSKSRIYELIQQGKFPKPVALGAMSVAWPAIEVHEWVAARIAERNARA